MRQLRRLCNAANRRFLTAAGISSVVMISVRQRSNGISKDRGFSFVVIDISTFLWVFVYERGYAKRLPGIELGGAWKLRSIWKKHSKENLWVLFMANKPRIYLQTASVSLNKEGKVIYFWYFSHVHYNFQFRNLDTYTFI